jgi:V/A-type H+-transporting ATPase subunit D
MDETSPTRMNLLASRSQHALAVRGVDLLQKKRDALVREFFMLVHETLDARRQLNAVFSLSLPVVSNAHAEVENVWGTRVPRLEVEWTRKATVGPLSVGGQTLAAQAAFRRLCRALIQVANTESRLRRIGEEIKKTARRVNALQQAVIPGLQSQIHYISQVLDQQEQEDIFRLKRVKRKIDGLSASKAASRSGT